MMKQLYRTGLAAGASVAVLSAALAPAMAREKAGSEVFQGLVQHVSTNNLKVTDPKTKQTESFLLMPHFGNIFKADGRKTAQQKDLAEGQYVKVYFDQKAFGVRHADRILILDDANITMQKMKS
jgi:hypothetical protein